MALCQSPPSQPKPGGGVNLIAVSGHAGPWDPTLNSAFDYGSHDQAPPAVVSAATGIPLSPGGTLQLTFVDGAVSAGGGWPDSDANGAVSRAPTSSASNTGNYPSRHIGSSAYPIYVASLVGTFAKDGVIVGRPFKVGDGPLTLIVPPGANQLLLGVNDDRFGDNSGSWVVEVRAERGGDNGDTRNLPPGSRPKTSRLPYYIGAIGLMLAIATYAVTRRKRSPNASSTPQSPALERPPLRWSPELPPRGAPAPTAGARPISKEALDKLVELKSLLDARLITQEEFDRGKAELLSSIR